MRIVRTALVAMLVALPGPSPAEGQKTYKLIIGETALDINPGESLDVTMPDGKSVKVTLELNAFATYSGDTFSFVHPTGIAITKTALDTDINQYLAASALGTIVIVQEYASINPVTLNQLMLQELTKESVQAGAELTQEPATKRLADGRELAGLKAITKTRTEESRYEVFSFGTVDRGLVLVTHIDAENVPSDGAIIDRFWESLEIRL